MIKRRPFWLLFLIAIIPACGWPAVIGLVIKPNIWVGATLAIIGGIAIGAVVVYLMWRWWFKAIQG